jgi:hypothetical protein
MTDIVVKRPKDVIVYCQNWFKEYQTKHHISEKQVGSDSDNEEVAIKIQANKRKPQLAMKRKVVTS